MLFTLIRVEAFKVPPTEALPLTTKSPVKFPSKEPPPPPPPELNGTPLIVNPAASTVPPNDALPLALISPTTPVRSIVPISNGEASIQ